MTKLAVIIGRFQPFHNGHLHIFNQALKWSDNILVIVGSVNEPRTPKNPFTYQERCLLIKNCFDKTSNLTFEGVEDSKYNDRSWFLSVSSLIKKHITQNTEVRIFGFNKDKTSEYFEAKQLGFLCEPVEPFKTKDGILNATNIRKAYFENTYFNISCISPSTLEFLNDFQKTNDFTKLQAEYNYYKDYQNNTFPKTYITTDAVVIKDNKILLITRKRSPGKNLLALPGGFLNQKEWIADCCIRELVEETKLNVPKIALQGFLKNTKVFDDPSRSERGRVITFASLFDLTLYRKEISVFPNDDANGVGWYDIDEVILQRHLFFEDHLDIIKQMINIA